MHSIMFVATIPPERHDWQFSELSDKRLEQLEGVARLAENVWLLDLTKTVQAFGRLVYTAEQEAISYALLPFEREPEWLPADFDPNTTLARMGARRV